MRSNFWIQVEEAYARAAVLPEDARTPFLRHTYPDRPDIWSEVESLLQYKPAADLLNQSTVLEAAVNMFSDDDHGLIGSVVGGKYLVRQRLGGGQMGEIFLADHMVLNVPFALKCPAPRLKGDPELRQRMLDEARRAVVLKHENVARVHDIIESGEDIFVVMEYIEGETLRSRLRSLSRPVTAEEFFPIAVQCASALAAAHQKRIVHLDVKPENIMLTPAGQVKICDFGVARKLTQGTASSTTTGEGDWTFAGTPAYMAPEVILSYQFDERADQFSLGIVFYEMLTGKNPFLADTVVATTARVVKDVPPPIRETNPQVDPKLERIVMRLLAKEPEDRYAGASELVEDLQAARRSRDRFRRIVDNIREVFAENTALKLLTATLLSLLLAAPAAWVYRDRIQQLWLRTAPLPERKIVAILPLRLIGNGGDTVTQSYLDGLTEKITALLSQLAVSPALEVVPSSAVRDDGVITPEDARKNFAANLVLDSSMQTVGEVIRVSLALIDTKAQKQLRGTSITISDHDSIAVQNQTAAAAIGMLEIELDAAAQSLLTIHGTKNPEAYRAYLQGMGYLANRTPEGIDSAIQSFRQALAVDWNFSLAYAGLGNAFWNRYINESKDPQPQVIERARDACDKAVSIDSNFAAGHVCLGKVFYSTGDYSRAVEEFGRAVELERTNEEAHKGLGRSHERLNNWEAAEASYLKAIEVQPGYWYNYQSLAQFYLFSRQQRTDAIAQYQKAIDRAPENSEPYFGLCAAYLLSGRYTEALQACNKSIELKASVSAYINLGVAYWDLRNFQLAAQSFEQAVQLRPRYYKAAGHLARAYSRIPEKRAEAPELFRKAISLANEELSINPREPDVNVMVARYHAMLGHRAEALSHLQIALSLRPKDAEYQEIAAVIHNQFGEKDVAIGYLQRAIAAGYSLEEVDTERELDNLREDPRFRALRAN